MSARPALRALAERLGVVSSYRDTSGCERETPDATRERLLRALGHEASDEASAQRALEALDREAAARLIEPVLVYREWEHGAPALIVNRRALRGALEYAITLRLESGETRHSEGRFDDVSGHAALTLPLPGPLPTGHHDLLLGMPEPGGLRIAEQRLILAPRTAFQPEEALGGERAFGLLANLYSLRGARGFGHGHFGDLAALAQFAGQQAADFVGMNPLHAVTNRGLELSPYGPSSRLYRNVLYLDPEAVPELARCAEARALLDEPALRARRAALEAAAEIDHEAVLAALSPVLRALHRGFQEHATAERMEAYALYGLREGAALDDFVTWELLREHFAPPDAPGDGAWWRWPEAYRDPRAPAVEAFRREHANDVGFRRWLQFELDVQLARAARSARGAGCRLGLYQDLALGAARGSADTWMQPRLFASGVSLGAPPDAYAPEGQDWGLPPLHPQQMREDGYRFFTRILRSALGHAGAVRLDHAIGLVRLFWIPEGRPGSEGAYVAQRADELLGVLALESRRQRAVVIAEDLGTLPPELPGLLADWGLLRSAVTRFEREADGRFRPASYYPPRALATLGTHDLPPLAGFVAGADLATRRAVGALATDALLDSAQAERADEIDLLIRRLREDGLLPQGGEVTLAALARAAHAFLASTPSVLVAASLDDLADEIDAVNYPGVPLEQHRSWSRRMREPLTALLASPELALRLEALRARSRRGPQPD